MVRGGSNRRNTEEQSPEIGTEKGEGRAGAAAKGWNFNTDGGIGGMMRSSCCHQEKGTKKGG